MAAPVIIRSTDVGAPTLSRVASSLISVLDYCLLGNGWTKPFSDTNKAVYKSTSTESKYYRILNDGSFYYSSTAYQYCHAKLEAYDTMSTVDSGTGLWATGYIFLSDTTVVARPWMCIVGTNSFWFITCPFSSASGYATAFSVPHYIGMTIPSLPGQTARSFIAYASLNLTSGSGLHCPTQQRNLTYSRSLDGSDLSVTAYVGQNGGYTGYAVSSSLYYPAGNAENISRLLDYPYNGSLLRNRPMLVDTTNDFPLGDFLQGFYYTSHNRLCFSNWQTVDNHIVVHTRRAEDSAATMDTVDKGCFLIDISAGYDV